MSTSGRIAALSTHFRSHVQRPFHRHAEQVSHNNDAFVHSLRQCDQIKPLQALRGALTPQKRESWGAGFVGTGIGIHADFPDRRVARMIDIPQLSWEAVCQLQHSAIGDVKVVKLRHATRFGVPHNGDAECRHSQVHRFVLEHSRPTRVRQAYPGLDRKKLMFASFRRLEIDSVEFEVIPYPTQHARERRAPRFVSLEEGNVDAIVCRCG